MILLIQKHPPSALNKWESVVCRIYEKPFFFWKKFEVLHCVWFLDSPIRQYSNKWKRYTLGYIPDWSNKCELPSIFLASQIELIQNIDLLGLENKFVTLNDAGCVKCVSRTILRIKEMTIIVDSIIHFTFVCTSWYCIRYPIRCFVEIITFCNFTSNNNTN